MSHTKQLAQRRKVLMVRCAVQRADMLADVYLMRYGMSASRIGMDVWGVVREHKMMIAGAILATVVVKPWRIIAGLKAVAIGWQTLRNFMPLLQNVTGLLWKRS